MTVVRDAEPGDKYGDKLGKILPGELTATYFLIRSFAGNNSDLSQYLLLLAVILCLAFYFISPKMMIFTTVRNRLLYCVTFLFWIAAIDNYRFTVDVLRPPEEQVIIFVFLASSSAAIWSFLVPHMMDQRR